MSLHEASSMNEPVSLVEGTKERMMGSAFIEYLNPDISLEERLDNDFDEARTSPAERADLLQEAALIREHDEDTYRHSIRVGLLMYRIASYYGLDKQEVLRAGILHDVGKRDIEPELLRKTTNWTADDSRKMTEHVLTGYDRLKNKYPVAAYVALLHHSFQLNPYPSEEHLADFRTLDKATQELMLRYAKVAAWADVYDALHRVNQRNGSPALITGETIKQKMLAIYPNDAELINRLYDDGVFTVDLLEGASADLPGGE